MMANLRKFDVQPEWAELFRQELGSLSVKAINAFGTLYCVDEEGRFYVFDPETMEPDDSGIDWDAAMAMVDDDPAVIEDELYQKAVSQHGQVEDDEVFSLKVERILGGKATIDNMVVLKIREHFEKMNSVIRAVRNDPEGTVYGSIRIKRS